MNRILLAACMAMSISTAAWAQQNKTGNLPNSAPLKTMEQAHSYGLINHSKQAIISANARMTNGNVRALTWDKPILPDQGRNVAVPSNDCLASLTVHLKSGRTLQSTGKPDCHATHITVTDNAIEIASPASNRPPVNP